MGLRKKFVTARFVYKEYGLRGIVKAIGWKILSSLQWALGEPLPPIGEEYQAHSESKLATDAKEYWSKSESQTNIVEPGRRLVAIMKDTRLTNILFLHLPVKGGHKRVDNYFKAILREVFLEGEFVLHSPVSMAQLDNYLREDIDLIFIEMDFLEYICRGKDPFAPSSDGSTIAALLRRGIAFGSRLRQINKDISTPRLRSFLNNLLRSQMTAVHVMSENEEKDNPSLCRVKEMIEDIRHSETRIELSDIDTRLNPQDSNTLDGANIAAGHARLQEQSSVLRDRLLKRRTLTRAFPTNLQIELGNVCNIKCRMCPIVGMKREKGFMEMDTFHAIIRKADDAGIGLIRFTLFGEALLHPDVVEMIRLAKQKNLAVGLNTNGLALNPHLSRQVIEAGLDFIIFSFDGATKATYENIRINSNFEKVEENIRRFVDLRNELQSKTPHTRIQTIPMKDSLGEIEEFKKKWSGIIDETAVTHTYAMDEDLHKQMQQPVSFIPHCRFPWDLLVVYYDGTVGYCCKDVEAKLVLGNIKDHSLEELWNSRVLTETRRNLRREDLAKLPELCSHCHIDGQWI